MEFSEILAWVIVVLIVVALFAASHVLHRINLAYARFIFRTFSHKHILFGFLVGVLLVVITLVLVVSEMRPPEQ
jgi:hypothetical protein